MTPEEKAVFVEKLLSMAKEEIRVGYKESQVALEGPVSKIGGNPYVPADFEWPYYTSCDYLGENKAERPLSFLAQFDMKDLAPLDAEGVLPKTGMLSFFYEMRTMRWGFEPDDLNAARVYFFPELDSLQERDLPDGIDEYDIVPEFAVDFAKHISIPEIGDYREADKPGWDDYEECSQAAGYEPDEWGTYTKFLGYPDTIQGPMEEECEAVTRGYSQGCPEDYAMIPDEEKVDIAKKAKDWMLLFQMGTVEKDGYELMFGDCGHIYFWIRKEDLAARRFDKVWMILQCS